MPASSRKATRTAAQKNSVSSYGSAVYWLAGATIAASLFGAAPAVWEIVVHVQYLHAPGSSGIGRWALVVLLLGCVESAYAIYLLQLPDWTSVRVVAGILLCLAGLYAMGLAIVLIADPAGRLIGPGGLQLTDKLAGGRAALWCLCMVSLSAVLAFFAGRLSAHWQRAESVRRTAGL